MRFSKDSSLGKHPGLDVYETMGGIFFVPGVIAEFFF
jgi:hypothetical protein